MYKFKRNYYDMADTAVVVAWLIFIVVLCIDLFGMQETVTELKDCIPFIKETAVKMGILIVAMVLKTTFVPRDYNYNVEVKEDIIIFCYSENDKRVMQKTFTCTKTRTEIVLFDGNAIITVPYDKDVMKFLDEVKK